MRSLKACILVLTVAFSFLAKPALATTPPASVPILWDPGLTHEGTRVISNSTDVATNVLYRITTANPSVGAWRTALKVHAGEAHVYLRKGQVPTITAFDFKSDRPGSDGFVLASTQFAPNELWYILVEARAGARYSLISGAPFVQDIGEVAADGSSGSGEVIMGPEGVRFFS